MEIIIKFNVDGLTNEEVKTLLACKNFKTSISPNEIKQTHTHQYFISVKNDSPNFTKSILQEFYCALKNMDGKKFNDSTIEEVKNKIIFKNTPDSFIIQANKNL